MLYFQITTNLLILIKKILPKMAINKMIKKMKMMVYMKMMNEFSIVHSWMFKMKTSMYYFKWFSYFKNKYLILIAKPITKTNKEKELIKSNLRWKGIELHLRYRSRIESLTRRIGIRWIRITHSKQFIWRIANRYWKDLRTIWNI